MLRMLVAMIAAAAFVLFAGSDLLAAKKGAAVKGTVKKVDAATGTITVAVKVKKETMDKEFKIDDATKVVIINGEDKKELSGKDGLKAEQLKEGAAVTIMADESGKVTQLQIGNLPKKKKTNQ